MGVARTALSPLEVTMPIASTEAPVAADAAVLDFGGAPPDPAAAVRRFDSTPPGQTLLLRARAPLDPVRVLLRRRHCGAFEWTPTLEGPWYWEVEVFRREGVPPALRRVNEALAWDHRRLEALERRTFCLQAQGRSEMALRLYARFAHGLRRHIRIEEMVMLPELERRRGLDPRSGPTARVRAEHRAIEALLREVASRPGPLSLRPNGPAGELRALRQRHEQDEETVEGMLESLLGDEESDALVDAMQSLPPAP
jgi:hypothetical protein